MPVSGPFPSPSSSTLPIIPAGLDIHAGLRLGETAVLLATHAGAPEDLLVLRRTAADTWETVDHGPTASSASARLCSWTTESTTKAMVALGDRMLRVSPTDTQPIAPPQTVTTVTAVAGRLFAAGPEGVLASADEGHTWTPAGPGPEAPHPIARLAPLGGSLVAVCPAGPTGFSLWRADASAGALAWSCVVARGAVRYALNQEVPAHALFRDALYLGTSAGTPPDVPGVSAAPELLSLPPQGGWEVVVGTPRFSPDGLKVPLAAWAAGFGDATDAAVSALAAHDGTLYALLAPLPCQAPPGPRGSARLWKSPDGEEWAPVTVPGLDTLAPARCLLALPEGLCVGGHPGPNGGSALIPVPD